MLQLGNTLAQTLLLVVLHLGLKALDLATGLVGLAADFLLNLARLLAHCFASLPSLLQEVDKDVALTKADARLRVAHRFQDFTMGANVGKVACVNVLMKLPQLEPQEVLGAVNLPRDLTTRALNRAGDRVTGALSSRDTMERMAAVIATASVVMTVTAPVTLARSDGGNSREGHAVVIVTAVAITAEAEAPETKARANARTD